MLTVNGDQGVVERQLAGGELACPKCGGVLGGWGHGRLRRIRFLDGPDASELSDILCAGLFAVRYRMFIR